MELLGRQSDAVVHDYLARAKGFIFAAEEDFGIVVLEAQAAGTPVIAFGKGGALETVVEGKTGIFFKEQSLASLIDAIRAFEKKEFDPKVLQRHAAYFNRKRFQLEWKALVERKWEEHHENHHSRRRQLTRLWPISRQSFPKQFLHFGEKYSLLQKTIQRYLLFQVSTLRSSHHHQSELFSPRQIPIKCSRPWSLESRSSSSLIGKNTAPAICLGVKYLEEKGVRVDPSECFLVSSSDHLIFPEDLFLQNIKRSRRKCAIRPSHRLRYPSPKTRDRLRLHQG